jgi:hypothetical protein
MKVRHPQHRISFGCCARIRFLCVLGVHAGGVGLRKEDAKVAPVYMANAKGARAWHQTKAKIET